MDYSALFILALRRCESLPPEVRSYEGKVLAVEESCFDESYIEFLDEQIQLSPRGPEWTERLRRRRECLERYCGVVLIRGIVPFEDSHFVIRVAHDQGTVAHWESYDFLYLSTAA